MSDIERAKEWLNEMSSDNLDRILYFMNLVLTKKELITENCNLKNEKQQLISFLEDKIKNITDYAVSFGLFIDKDISHEIDIKKQIYQEVLDFVNKGGGKNVEND